MKKLFYCLNLLALLELFHIPLFITIMLATTILNSITYYLAFPAAISI